MLLDAPKLLFFAVALLPWFYIFCFLHKWIRKYVNVCTVHMVLKNKKVYILIRFFCYFLFCSVIVALTLFMSTDSKQPVVGWCAAKQLQHCCLQSEHFHRNFADQFAHLLLTETSLCSIIHNSEYQNFYINATEVPQRHSLGTLALYKSDHCCLLYTSPSPRD